MPIGTMGSTNMLKVRTVEDLCFTGQGASGTTAEGKIRVIKNAGDWLNLPEEAIVVVNATDESMMVYLRQVKGIITEQPGFTSHAAIVGRELNIPVVCNVLDATTFFKNGQTVTIDGSTGRISYGSISSR
jgi:pyruvate kinase